MDIYQEDPAFAERLRRELAGHGLDGPATWELGQLFGVDQFHVGGPEPIRRLVTRSGLGPGDRVLDLGAGFGGTARLVAATTGASVLGVDRSPRYVEAARWLTERCGLAGRVRFAIGDVTALGVAPNSFDGALLVHVQLNVEHKSALFAEIRRVLRPGACLLLWEVAGVRPGALRWPLPWSRDGRDSHLVSQAALRDAIAAAGFHVSHWEDRSEWARRWIRRLKDEGPPPGPALPRVLVDGHERFRNMGAAALAGHLAFVEGVAYQCRVP